MQTENERIRQKNREATARAYQNIYSALNNEDECDGINAVLKFLNEKTRINTELPLSEQLKQIEEQLYIKTRYVELDEDWYTVCGVPMLVKTSEGRWLAAVPRPGGGCTCIDGGKRIRLTNKNVRRFTNNAMCFYKCFKNGRITARELLSFMLKAVSLRDRITVLVACAAAVFAGMLLPWANSLIFSRIIPTGQLAGAVPAAALIFSAVSAAAILRLLQELILTNAMLRVGSYMQSGIFSRLLSLKPEFFKNMKSGELSRMVIEFSDITKMITVRSISACIGIVLSSAYLIQIHIYAPQLLGSVLLITVLLGAMLAAEGILNSKWLRGYSKALSKMSGFCYELFSGIAQIKLNGAEPRMMNRWSQYYLDAARKEDKPQYLKYVGAMYKLSATLMTAVVFILGARLSASNYIAFSAAYGAYTAALMGASEMIRTISSFLSSYSLIKPVLTAECEEYGGEKKKTEALQGEITISDLYFRYDRNSPYVINGLSAHVPPGGCVGIIGGSGCGKSTLIRLLLGFEQAEEGSIYIDGFDLRELDLRSYRQKVGTVLQNSGLVSGDIYSNITLIKPQAGMDEVNAVVSMVGLSKDIAALPMGLHTPVNSENCTLSGGQQQKILIARALLPKPALLIFDEATSALDTVAQAEITDCINQLKCTKIIVAHRLSTVEKCDRIWIMKGGVIVEQGTAKELLNSGGPLKKLMKNQIQ